MRQAIIAKEEAEAVQRQYANQFADKYAQPEPDRNTIHLHLADDEIGVLLSFLEKEIARLSKLAQTHERQKDIIRLEYIQSEIVGNA